MSYFRLYFMDPRSGRIQRFKEFEAPGDEDALALAREDEGPLALELWCERRKVARIDPPDSLVSFVERSQPAGETRARSSGSGG